ncbi:MAG: response regulator transcription factor [Actinomycetota bacterium]
MVERRVRVMVGEGQTARKGLLRFVLENEGYDVVAEATSTLELAQRLAIHRPDVVVLDDGIDASAVGMMREVLPSAKVILVWPRGVTAVGSDARLEPSEVMTSLGSTVARVMGRGGVIAPPRPRVPPPDVIVVPEPEQPPQPTKKPTPLFEPVAPAEPVAVVESVAPLEPIEEPVVVPEALPGVMMKPSSLEAPRWVYTAAEGTSAAPTRRGSRPPGVPSALVAASAVIVAVIAVVLGTIYLNSRTVAIQSITGSTGAHPSPGGGGTGSGGTATVPGTYEGVVHLHANGTLRLRASGNLRLRVVGISHIVVLGDVRIHGDGVISNVSSSHVRVRGNGTIHIVLRDGHIRLRVQGSLIAQGNGTVRIGGDGRFLIHHRPV